MVVMPLWRAGSGREALQEGQEWSGGPPGGPGEVERPSWRATSGPEVIPEGREWLGGPPRGPGVVRR